jgi:pilus assembly protein Flp/PilA
MNMLKQTLEYYLTRLRVSEEGATAIEYGILAALIAVAIILTVTAVGTSLQGVFTRVSTALAP